MFLKLITSIVCIASLSATTSVLYRQIAKIPTNELAESVAYVIWEGSDEKDIGYIKAVIAGMMTAQDGLSSQELEILDMTLDHCDDVIEAYLAQENLAVSDEYFREQALDHSICIISDQLYYQKVKDGYGVCLPADTGQVEIRCHIRPIPGTSESPSTYADTFMSFCPQRIPFADLMPGLAQGIVGMRVGEVRKLLIHPALTFPSSALITPGIALLAEVELHAFGGKSNSTHIVAPESKPLPPISNEEYHDCRTKVAELEGMVCWDHFRKAGNLLNVDEVSQALLSIATNPPESPISREPYSKLQCLLAATLTNESSAPQL